MTVWDEGLQPERTALAWRRSALAMLAGSLVATRVLPEIFGIWAILPGMLGVTLASVLLVAAHRRYRRHVVALTGHSTELPVAGGVLVAITALFGILAAGASIAIIIAVFVFPLS